MPAAVLTKGEWEEVKLASIAGIPDSKITSEWGITHEALRAKRSRGKWPTQERVEIERRKAREALNEGRSTLMENGNNQEEVQSGVTAVDVIAKTKEEYGETNRMVLLSKLSPVLQHAVTSRPGDFSPQDIKELVSLGSFLHKMADLDKPESSVSVSVWGGSAGLSHDLRDVEGQTRELTAEERGMLE